MPPRPGSTQLRDTTHILCVTARSFELHPLARRAPTAHPPCTHAPTCLAPPPAPLPAFPARPQANEILHHKLTLNGYLAEFTGQSLEQITLDTDRDFFMSAQEAVEYGLIDAGAWVLCCSSGAACACLSGVVRTAVAGGCSWRLAGSGARFEL